MAQVSRKLAGNATGDFYVDDTCIDCDTCRQIAPDIFERSAAVAASIVRRQPEDASSALRASMALVSCPTASIGSGDKNHTRQASFAFPELIEGNVYYCGYAAESSFGASSYLIRRPQGNVLVDSPRAAGPLIKRLNDLGGVHFMFLTHRDDVADHARLAREFGCQRILHRADVTERTRDIEMQPVGDAPIQLSSDLLIIPVPGHTRGSAALLYKDTFLFTGDHLWADQDTGKLAASRSVSWYSWGEQIRSLEKLLGYSFNWILPGHERRFHAASANVMHGELRELLQNINA